jgi:drug/metabolite transporter (DMT)-like permease
MFCSRGYHQLRHTDPHQATIALGTAASFVAFLLWGIFSEVFARWRILGILFVMFALTVGTVYKDSALQERNNEPN